MSSVAIENNPDPTAASPAATANAPARTRIASVEVLRILGAYGVIDFHCRGSFADIGIAGLYIFIVLLSLFAAQSKRVTTLSQSIAYNGRRLLLPWIAASAFYLVFAISVQGVAKVAEIYSNPFVLLIGPRIHLWFLPYAFLCTVLIQTLAPRWPASLRDNPARYIALVAVPLLSIACSTAVSHLPAPIAQWVACLPALCAGIALSGLVRSRASAINTAAIAACCIALIALAYFQLADWRAAIAIAAVAVALQFRALANPVICGLSGLTLGIYLLHLFVYNALFSLGLRQGSHLDIFLVFVTSAVLTALLRLTPLRAVL